MSHVGAPFPWFGGKSAVAADVWRRFGDVPNYVEPFAGSLAVLLARPHKAKTETVNDLDGMIANFWRAVQAAPGEVATHADWPVNEVDLHARHYWLVTEGRARLDSILGHPEAYDAKVAGWWLWGACSWIGSGWCSGEGPWSWDSEGGWINRKLPHVGDAGRGINRQLPHVGNAGMGDRAAFILGWMLDLQARLRNIRVAWGDWSRVTGPSVTTRHGLTAVFLDPPYPTNPDLYTEADGEVAAACRAWAIENGSDPLLRIALCGYDGEHALPEGWTCLEWKARGGYGSQGEGEGRANASRERIWFSPHCLDVSAPKQATLWEDLDK
jgi:DNA adenine methylase